MIQLDNVNSIEKGASQSVKAPVNTAAIQTDTTADSVSKEIQTRIIDARKQKQELSFNTEISAQERERRRQKIEQEISELKRELRLREAEEKKKQQEAEKAIAKKEEQQKDASLKSSSRQEAAASAAQNTNDRGTENSPGSNDKNTDESAVDGQVSEILPNGMHRIISAGSVTQQFHMAQSVSAKADAAARIQDAEIKQDSARGADVTKLQKTRRKESQKEIQRMEMVHTIIFGDKNNKSTEPSIGIKNLSSTGFRANGIYGSNGLMSRYNFQSVQMDLTQ